jgi:hypothetical protein
MRRSCLAALSRPSPAAPARRWIGTSATWKKRRTDPMPPRRWGGNDRAGPAARRCGRASRSRRSTFGAILVAPMHGQRAPTPSDRKRLACLREKPIAFVAALVAVWAFPAIRLASADQGVPVLLLRRVPADEILTEAILRIKSELVAGGFQVAVADSDGAEPDPRALMVRVSADAVPRPRRLESSAICKRGRPNCGSWIALRARP